MNFKLSKKEILINISLIILIIFLISKLFYGTFLAGIVLAPLIIPIFKRRKTNIQNKKKKALEQQFKDMLISISDAMNTGYSIENAIVECHRDLQSIYGYESPICIELRLMKSRLKLNMSVDAVLEDFAFRTDLPDAKMFYEIFTVAKKTGGNMTNIIKNVTDNIVLKQSVNEEIDIAINSKKLEQKIMTVIPLFIIGYISMASPGFLNVMYETWMGRIIMTIFILLYFIAYLWSEKIASIEI